MKKILLFIFAVTFLAFSFSSCKKKDEESTTQKIQHKWTLVNTVYNYHDASGDNITTQNGSSSDYVNFNSNGTYTSLVGGASDSGSYSVDNDNQITVDGEPLTIKTITSSQLILYAKEEISSTEYEETTFNFSR